MKSRDAAIVSIVIVLLIFSHYAIAGTWSVMDMPGAEGTFIAGIDGSNIVGWYWDTSGNYNGFLYNGTSWTTLNMPGAIATMIHGIDHGNLAGWYYDTSGNGHGFIYNGTTWTKVDKPGATFTLVYGIDGTNVVGQYKDSSGLHGFLYDGTTWTKLGFPAYGIEGSNIVGKDILYNITNGTQTKLFTSLSGIDGQNIVGDTDGHGFLYNGSTLTTLDKPGAYNTWAMDIDGSNIVGYFDNAYSAGYQGFIYTIPEPATLLLFTLGGLALRKSRLAGRRKH